MENWADEQNDRDESGLPGTCRAPRIARSIERFWYEAGNYLYDVVDTESPTESGGNVDAKCRPNQVLSISLAHPFWRRAVGRQ